jgi:hypothetical protein
MSLTKGVDLYGAVDEEGINRFVRHLLGQRPSLFNFATPGIAAYPEEFLSPPVPLSPAQVGRDQPRVTEVSPLPVLGTDGPVELEYCAQLTAFEFDFHPGEEFQLPVGGTLEEQQFGARAALAVGVGCPNDAAPEFRRRVREGLVLELDLLTALRRRTVTGDDDGRAGDRSFDRGTFGDGALARRPVADGGRRPVTDGGRRLVSTAALGGLRPGFTAGTFTDVGPQVLVPPDLDVVRKPDVTMHRFDLHAFVVGTVDVGSSEGEDALAFELDHLELGGGDDGSAIDLPGGLKDTIECYLDLYVRHVVLPSVSEMARRTVADALDNDLLKTELTPEDPTVRFPETDRTPHNPNVADDRLEAFVDLDVAGEEGDQ